MPEEPAATPGQQVTTPAQQANATPGTAAPEGYIEIARYTCQPHPE